MAEQPHCFKAEKKIKAHVCKTNVINQLKLIKNYVLKMENKFHRYFLSKYDLTSQPKRKSSIIGLDDSIV